MYVAGVPQSAFSTRGILSAHSVETGFRPKYPRLHRAYNIVVALALCLLVLPLILVIVLALFVTQGREIFYRGPRVGLNQRIFHILKFRTLDNEKAARLTQDGVLPPGTGIETPLGKFLRDTRLDEIPQLFNVLAGDMNLCGPRPVRPVMATLYRREVPRFDDRFTVKPGLVGHSQALMSHGTSKIIRERYNRLLCKAPVSYRAEIALIAVVGSCVIARGCRTLLAALAQRLAGTRRSGESADTLRARRLRVTFTDAATRGVHPVLAIGKDRFLLASRAGAPFPAGTQGWIGLVLPNGSRRRARVHIGPTETAEAVAPSDYAYHPASDFADYLLGRYLMMIVVVPHKSHLALVSLGGRIARAWPRARPAGSAARPAGPASAMVELP